MKEWEKTVGWGGVPAGEGKERGGCGRCVFFFCRYNKPLVIITDQYIHT